jgi:predicted transcriptional regulator
MAIIEDPTMTQRAISVYLGCSETLVDKTVKALVDAGMITKTKVNRKNIYVVDFESVQKHSDIQHLGAVIDALRAKEAKKSVKIAQRPSTQVGDDEPF